MVSFGESLAEDIRQGLCNTLSTAQRTAQLGERFYDTIGLRPVGDLSGQAAQLWSNASAFACNRVPQDLSGEVVSPFEGGQCPGTLYNFFAASQFPPQGPSPPFFVDNIIGPLSYVEFDTDTQRFTQILDGNGDPAVSASTTLMAEQPIIFVTDVTRVDGLPDDCGNPPAVGPPYNQNDFTVPTTVNFDDRDGAPQSLDVDIVYRPTNTNDSGDFIVPFEVNFNDGSQLFGDFNLSVGDISVGGGNSDGDGVGNEAVELEENEDEVPDGLVIVGARVSVTIDPNASTATEIFSSDGSPNLFVPRLGTIRFNYVTPTGGSVLGPDLSVKQQNELFWSGPVATGVVVQENIGATISVRLVVVKESAVGLFGGGGST